MTSILRRWLLPAALSAICGVALAVWQHGGPDAQAERAHPIATQVVRAPVPAPRRDPAATDAAAAPEAVAVPALAGPRDLERLRQTLTDRLETDVPSALAALLTLNPQQRAYLAEDLLRRAAEHAPQVTVQWIDEHFVGSREREMLLVAAYAGMAARDPVFAMNAVQNIADAEYRRLGSHQVLEAWAAQDVQAAYEWARGQTGEGAADLYVTVMEAYIEQLPRQAGELIAGLPASRIRSRLMDRYAFELAASDAPAALQWLSQFEAGVSAQQALTSVYDQWAQQDPWAAIDHAVVHMDGEVGAELIGKAALQMGSERPHELAASLQRIPDGYRTLAAQQLAYAWAASDPGRAERWVDSLPAGELQAHARRGLAASRRGG